MNIFENTELPSRNHLLIIARDKMLNIVYLITHIQNWRLHWKYVSFAPRIWHLLHLDEYMDDYVFKIIFGYFTLSFPQINVVTYV